MKYVDASFAGDAPVELIKRTVGRGRYYRDCDGCGKLINAGAMRVAITGKYNGKISTQYFCADCCPESAASRSLPSNPSDQRPGAEGASNGK